jgi:ABC-type phosphate transport system permease subunit
MKIGNDILLLGAGTLAFFLVAKRQTNINTAEINTTESTPSIQNNSLTNTTDSTYIPVKSLQDQQTPFINTVEGVLIISFVASLLASYVAYKQFEKK